MKKQRNSPVVPPRTKRMDKEDRMVAYWASRMVDHERSHEHWAKEGDARMADYCAEVVSRARDNLEKAVARRNAAYEWSRRVETERLEAERKFQALAAYAP